MPLFYFDVREDGRLNADEEGQDLPGIDAVEAEAVEAAAHIAKDVLPSRQGGEVAVEVRDARGTRVLTVSVELRIARIPPIRDVK
jgi:hypothetical protein